MNKRLFIIGGMGYLGSALARRELMKGHVVCLYDSLMYEQILPRMLQEIRGESNDSNLTYIIGDTRNTELLKKSLQDFQPTFVFHFGELSSVYACNHHPAFTEDVNYRASQEVLKICEELGLKVIYNSTSSVYGTQKGYHLVKENDSLPDPTDYYCIYKLKMEEFIRDRVRRNKNFRIIVFRPATVFGLSPRFRIELLPNHFTYMAIAKKVIPVSKLNAYRAAIDIADLLDAYERVIEKDAWGKLVYNIGHHNMTKQDFALGIQKVIPCKINSVPDIGDLRNLQIDSSQFEEEFDFHPVISYEKSIQNIATWIQDNLENLEGSNFAEFLNMPLDMWRKICS